MSQLYCCVKFLEAILASCTSQVHIACQSTVTRITRVVNIVVIKLLHIPGNCRMRNNILHITTISANELRHKRFRHHKPYTHTDRLVCCSFTTNTRYHTYR